MSEQKHDQKELLYSPKNWAFLSFFLSPILPAVFYYRNSKLLGTDQKGKKVLIGTIIFVVTFLALTFVFDYYAILIILVEAIIAVIIAKKLAKTQLAAYEEMKKSKGLKGGRNEAPLILIFLALWITIGFIIPYFINKYVEANYFTTKIGGETVYLPNKPAPIKEKMEKSSTPQAVNESDIQGKVNLMLPTGYTLSDKNESVVQKSYSFNIRRTDGTFDQSSWGITIVPIEAVRHFDSICAPGDCMRDFSIFPKEAHYLSDLEGIKEDEEPIVTILNGQKYYVFTVPVNGDTGYSRQYITYFNDIRVIFTAWAKTQFEAEKHDSFLKEVKILSIE
ncbi:hypothetical protein KA119_00780 [Candidatus Gracilibacteria bacterium]|nr:hypothetical protein [Candidatus Gracilibacteria bacterium]